MALVSLVLIFLNEERFLAEAVESVRDQTLTDWELILVDDGSTDRSTLIARDLAAQDGRIRYVEHPGHANRGMAASRNFGAAHCTAPYLGFFDGDDVLLPNKLSEQVEVLESMPEVAMVNGALQYWHSWDPAATQEDGVALVGGSDVRIDPPRAAIDLYPLGPGDGPGVDFLVRRAIFDTVGGFEEQFRGLYEDQSFKMKMYLRYPIYISSRVWMRYRQHDTSECATTSPTAYLRIRGQFLEWTRGEVEKLDDPSVTAAFNRARRRHLYANARAPFVRLSSTVLRLFLPLFPRRAKRLIRRVLHRAGMGWLADALQTYSR